MVDNVSTTTFSGASILTPMKWKNDGEKPSRIPLLNNFDNIISAKIIAVKQRQIQHASLQEKRTLFLMFSGNSVNQQM